MGLAANLEGPGSIRRAVNFQRGIGIKFDVPALIRDLTTMVLVPAFLLLFLLVRGLPVLLYRNDLAPQDRLPFVL